MPRRYCRRWPASSSRPRWVRSRCGADIWPSPRDGCLIDAASASHDACTAMRGLMGWKRIGLLAALLALVVGMVGLALVLLGPGRARTSTPVAAGVKAVR